MSDGLEPHDHVLVWDIPRGDGTHEHGVPAGGGEVYPGYGTRVGPGRGYTGYYQIPSRDP